MTYRNLSFITITLCLCLGSTPVHASGRGPCNEDRFDVKPRMGSTVVQRKVTRLIRCATERWSVPGGAHAAIDIANCESSLWPWARSGGNDGVFQIADWSGARAHWLRHRHWYFPRWSRSFPGAFKARANVIVAVRWAHVAGWGAWSCARTHPEASSVFGVMATGGTP